MGADAEIRTVLAHIAQLADTGDLDEYITMFTSDAVWAMPENPLLGMPANSRQGHEAILEGARERRASGLQGPGTDTRHVLTTLAIEVVDDAHANARSYFLYFGETSTAPAVKTMGQYDDVLVKGEHGWQLAHRTIAMG